jgi:hypothetical protein
MSSYITLEEFLEFFTSEKPKTMDEFMMNARVKIRNNIVPLKTYLDQKSISCENTEPIIRNVEPLYEHIINREKYLTEFYKRSLRVANNTIEIKIENELNNNKYPLLKNQIRSLFVKEILHDTKSGFENIPSFLEVLFNLYQYPDCIIDYKLITPSAIDYIEKGRIGSVFSSFYFRASIMNPALIHNIRMNFFPHAKTVLTPTLGWCSYLTGLSLLKSHPLEHYVGIDVIDSVCHHASHTPLGLYRPGKIDIYKCQSECVQEMHHEFNTVYRNYFDAIFFSPPYYKMELYDGEQQSTNQYNTYEEWLNNYWEKTVIMCKSVLNSTKGVMCYVISPFHNYDLPNDLLRITSKYFTLREIVPIYNKNVNSTKHREPDDKLYIFTSPL